MPTVLILGATGYLGLPLAQSLLRSGNYTVYGLARSAAKAKTLTQNEIIPVIGDVSDPSTFTNLISSVPIDVVIDTTSAYESASTLLDALIAASKSRKAALSKEGAVGPKLGFVYISGTWAHGDTGDTPVSDTIPPNTSLAKGTPPRAVGWRPAHERAVLAARDVLDVAIVRPAEVYGRTSWLFSTYWSAMLEAAKSGSTQPFQVPANFDSRPAVIHVDDVVSGTHLAIDRIHGLLGDWPVFDLVAETVLVRDLMEGAKKSFGLKGKLEYAGTQDNPFYEAMGLVTNVQSTRAAIVLGWQAKRQNFILQIDTYVKAWAAAQEESK